MRIGCVRKKEKETEKQGTCVNVKQLVNNNTNDNNNLCLLD